MPFFECGIQEHAGVVSVYVSGEIDLATARLLEAELRRCLDRSRPVVIDFTNVAYCDMSGIRVLERSHQALAERGHALAIAAPSGPMRRVFALVELDKRLTVTGTREEARALLTRAGSGYAGSQMGGEAGGGVD